MAVMYDLKELVNQTPLNRLIYLYRAILHRALCDSLGILGLKEKVKKNFIKKSQEYIGSKDFYEICFLARTNPNEIIKLYEKLKKEKIETRKSIAKRLSSNRWILQAKEIVYPGGLSLQMTISGFENREDVERFANLYLGNQYDNPLPSMNETIH